MSDLPTAEAGPATVDEQGRLVVRLNVYDVTNTASEDTNKLVVKVNNMTHAIGFGGVFHGGIEVDNVEWSYGYCERGSGVYSCNPTKNPMYQFRSSVDLGPTPKTRKEIREILLELRKEWPGTSYELLTRNCCHFCEAFCHQLECKPPPAYLNRFAQGADATIAFTNDAMELARAAAANVSRTAFWMREAAAKAWSGMYQQNWGPPTGERTDCLPFQSGAEPSSGSGFSLTDGLLGGLRFQPAGPSTAASTEQDGGEQQGLAAGPHGGPVAPVPVCMSLDRPVNSQPVSSGSAAAASSKSSVRTAIASDILAQSAAAAAAAKAAAAAAAMAREAEAAAAAVACEPAEHSLANGNVSGTAS